MLYNYSKKYVLQSSEVKRELEKRSIPLAFFYSMVIIVLTVIISQENRGDKQQDDSDNS